MLSLVAMILGALLLALVVTGAVFVVGMRRKSPTILGIVRWFARVVVNPRVLATAGTPGAYASVISHVGRTSGRLYKTPVVAERTAEGFVIALPYGTTANWVKNVLVSGCASIVDEGTTYSVDRPEIVPLSVMAEWFPAKDRRSFARLRVDRCLRFRLTDEREPSLERAARASRATAGSDREGAAAKVA